MKALVVLEDGTTFEGVSCGAAGEAAGEVVFNTAVVGFQELLTDPASRGQILVFTYPLIGNCGACQQDMESDRVQAAGLVIRDMSSIHSNFRAEGSFPDFLKKHGVVCVAGVDTRGLAVHVRDHGEMRAVVSTQDLDASSLVRKARAYRRIGGEVFAPAGAPPRKILEPASGRGKWTVGALDLGARISEMRQLQAAGCRVVVFPAQTPADEMARSGVERLCLIGGPSVLLPPPDVVENVRRLLGRFPIFGTGLGHNVLAAAMGCPSQRMQLGHRGVNQPVRNLRTRRVDITVQNHGVVVDRQAVEAAGKVEVTHEQINDHTIEGLRSTSVQASSVQYHPTVVEKDTAHRDFVEFLEGA
jgi:carbamoyl-phosphate synthase small subunit